MFDLFQNLIGMLGRCLGYLGSRFMSSSFKTL